MVSLRQHVTRKNKSSEEHILPLINVVFLLLIFFMIAGRLAADDPFGLKIPVSQSSKLNDPHLAVIHLGKNGKVAFQHKVVDHKSLERLVKEYLANNADGVIRLKVDGQHKAKDVLTLIMSLKSSGVQKISLVTELDKAK